METKKKFTRNKYLYLELNSSGLGNRVHSILSGFLLALLTKRILLIHSNDYDFNDIFCQPFPESNWIWPTTVKWSSIEKMDESILNWKTAMIHGADMETIQLLLTSYINGLHNIQIIRLLDGETYFLPMLYLHPPFQQQLLQWFPDNNPGTILAHYLLHPQNDIWNKIVTTYSTLLKSSPADDFVVGVQLRDREMTPDFLACLQEHFLSSQHQQNNKQLRFFVASMYEGVAMQLQRLSSNWNISHVFPETAGETHDITQTSHALHDIWILSMSDALFLSPHSTLGYLSLMLQVDSNHHNTFFVNTSSVRPVCNAAAAAGNSNSSKCIPILQSKESCYHRRFYGKQYYVSHIFSGYRNSSNSNTNEKIIMNNNNKNNNKNQKKKASKNKNKNKKSEMKEDNNMMSSSSLLFMACEDYCKEEYDHDEQSGNVWQTGYLLGLKLRAISSSSPKKNDTLSIL